ncbi:MAG: DUF465 domain-containing protein [Candidatus Solibacter sp.]|nr:DUF465 domain-containing protein [Candidatus Solibacter sp.]
MKTRDYPPSYSAFTDSARQPHYWEELPIMERIELEELKAHLMATNEEYRGFASQHSEFAHKLDELEALPHLTDQEQLEEVRLKKLKLRLKDQMEAIVSQSRSRQVA